MQQENIRQENDYYFSGKYLSKTKPSEYNYYSASFLEQSWKDYKAFMYQLISVEHFINNVNF